jgi:hypothetical protein
MSSERSMVSVVDSTKLMKKKYQHLLNNSKVSYEFKEDVKTYYPMFVDSYKRCNPKVHYYFGPYEQKKEISLTERKRL